MYLKRKRTRIESTDLFFQKILVTHIVPDNLLAATTKLRRCATADFLFNLIASDCF